MKSVKLVHTTFSGSDVTEKPIRCTHCRGAVTITFEVSRKRAPQSRRQAWVCPYCFKKNEGVFPALLQNVMKR